MGVIIAVLIICFIIVCLILSSNRKDEHKYNSDDPVYLAWRKKYPHGNEKDYENWLNKADSGYLDWLTWNPGGDEIEYQMWLDCDIWDED